MDTVGPLVLVGSGEFTEEMNAVDQFLLNHIKNPVIAIIPTAAGEEEDYQKWIDNGIKHFEKLGAKVFGVHLLTKSDAENDEILAQLNEANIFYFSGGDPGYLLDTIKDTKALNLILQKHKEGSILAGSSAGAMVLGSKVFARIYDFFQTGKMPDWEVGLGLVDFGVLPHFDKLSTDLSPDHIEAIKNQLPDGMIVVGIDEDTAFININNEWIVLGKGKVHNPAFEGSK